LRTLPLHLSAHSGAHEAVLASYGFSVRKKWEVLSNLGKARTEAVLQAGSVDQHPLATAEAESLVVSGLVITLNAQPDVRERATAAILSHPAIHAGELTDRWLPVAVEAADQAECHAIHDWLQSLEGVDYVDVVAISFEEAETTTH
jgi:hypothetical protein